LEAEVVAKGHKEAKPRFFSEGHKKAKVVAMGHKEAKVAAEGYANTYVEEEEFKLVFVFRNTIVYDCYSILFMTPQTALWVCVFICDAPDCALGAR
jgi:hypothetical protein